MQWSIAFSKFSIIGNFNHTPVYIKYNSFSLAILKAFTLQSATIVG